jgi:hypothetical protein
MPYFAFVAEQEKPVQFFAIKVLAESRGQAAIRAKAAYPLLVKLIDVGECPMDQQASDALYQKACNKADALTKKLHPTGCTKLTGELW